ncbi:MAG: NAD(P)-dependent oxidoreductase [Bacteroidota bacterium]
MQPFIMARMRKNVLQLEPASVEADKILNQSCTVFQAVSPDAGPTIAREHDIHAILTRGKGKVSADLIELCPRLEVIARIGVGLDNVDVAAASQRRVKVINAPGSNADTVAEHSLSLMLSLQRHLWQSFSEVKKGNWQFRTHYQGDEIRGKKLGIIGMGNIGRKVAKLADAFGMEVMYWDQKKQDVPFPMIERDTLFQTADIISLHLPLTNTSRHLIDQTALDMMQSHCLLINTARGQIVDQQALTQALQQQKIGGFAADVLETEPPIADDPLFQLPNVLITPHSASLTATTFNEMCIQTVQRVIALLAGQNIDPIFVSNHTAI